MSARNDTASVPLAARRPAARSLPYAVRGSLTRLLATVLVETRLNLLSPGPWVTALALAAFGYLRVRTSPDQSSFALGWGVSHFLGPLSTLLLVLLAAGLAYRPFRYDVTEVVDSKIVGSEELVAGRWLSMVLALLVPLLIQYLVVIAGQKIHSHEPILMLAYVQSLGRVLPPVLFLGTLAFCLVTLTGVLVLGGGIAALLWFALFVGEAHFPTVLHIELSQNAPLFLGLTLGCLLLMLAAYRGRRRRKRSAATYLLGAVTGLVFAATLIGGSWMALALPGKATTVAAYKRLGEASRRKGDPLPNFAWTDVAGARTSFASLRGRAGLVIFVQPSDSGLIPLLRRLAALRREFPSPKLFLLCVYLSEDLNVAQDAARVAGVNFPTVTDWGEPAGGSFDQEQPPSAVSWALKISGTPSGILVGVDGHEITRSVPLDEAGNDALKRLIRQKVFGAPADEPVVPSTPGLPAGGMQ